MGKVWSILPSLSFLLSSSPCCVPRRIKYLSANTIPDTPTGNQTAISTVWRSCSDCSSTKFINNQQIQNIHITDYSEGPSGQNYETSPSYKYLYLQWSQCQYSSLKSIETIYLVFTCNKKKEGHNQNYRVASGGKFSDAWGKRLKCCSQSIKCLRNFPEIDRWCAT